MTTDRAIVGMEAMKAKLSTLWVFVMLNILSADIFSFMLQESSGEAPFKVTQVLMLVCAVVLEIPIAMIFLSRVLKYNANRWANIIASVITILFVVGGGSPNLHYYFFAAVEIIAMLFIIRYAWKWTSSEGLS